MKGATVIYSEEYFKTMKNVSRMKDRRGIILGKLKNHSVYRVQWDGNKSYNYISMDFVQIVSEPIDLNKIAHALTELNQIYVTYTSAFNTTEAS